MRKLLFWLVVVVVLQTGDLVTTHIAGIEREANPIAVWAWTKYGLQSLVAGKALTILFFAGLWVLHGRYPPTPRKAFRVAQVIVTLLPLVAICLWNSYWLLVY